ncbi:TIGR02594 family protein [Polymorphobacter fuscus]|uniref:TIGR02594 family protein n=1 Tax=Sandarakinorhabdus fusca TaxID=1439888 RepID=A0A7C9GR34_9SPHN|nr:TIGR02594 family protein [Polymorphobacter fuscus]KAB7647565.1 TIGR02594 family protein [Polymorphobacter fuscus]MQT16831.1 TIGR02594 family protein [Polymorphobacter fuscus]NJC09181.1 uncharacterized protein (TIGR02594 family) [Polymorphobacter fuscus]
MNVTELQTALKSLGFDPGTIDGALGRNTVDAIKAFQTSRGIDPIGVVGPKTRAALAEALAAKTPKPAAAEPAESPLASLALPWLLEAQRCIGITEDKGPGSNPMLIGWGRRLKISYADDEIPWCGLFVAHCIGSQLPSELLPINPLGARNWARCGVDCAVPQPGAIMVFWRKSKTSGLGHVAFYVGEDDNSFHVLGGNQGDAVNVTRMPRARFLTARWPSTAPRPTGGPRRLRPDGALSENEQ